jgi:hypothetical protein
MLSKPRTFLGRIMLSKPMTFLGRIMLSKPRKLLSCGCCDAASGPGGNVTVRVGRLFALTTTPVTPHSRPLVYGTLHSTQCHQRLRLWLELLAVGMRFTKKTFCRSVKGKNSKVKTVSCFAWFTDLIHWSTPLFYLSFSHTSLPILSLATHQMQILDAELRHLFVCLFVCLFVLLGFFLWASPKFILYVVNISYHVTCLSRLYSMWKFKMNCTNSERQNVLFNKRKISFSLIYYNFILTDSNHIMYIYYICTLWISFPFCLINKAYIYNHVM